jgi:predicted adenine nucleotide alpha hydrolase (AANH) superfamily ATPase
MKGKQTLLRKIGVPFIDCDYDVHKWYERMEEGMDTIRTQTPVH